VYQSPKQQAPEWSFLRRLGFLFRLDRLRTDGAIVISAGVSDKLPVGNKDSLSIPANGNLAGGDQIVQAANGDGELMSSFPTAVQKAGAALAAGAFRC
jgi:hypothetical protein